MCTRLNRFQLLQKVENGKATTLIHKMKCKAWECPECGKRKAWLVGKRATENFTAEETRFLTLTMKPIEDKVLALRQIKQAWNKLRTYIVRNFGKTKYVWTLEIQEKTQMPHLHILLDRYIPSAWLNVWVTRCGFGRIYKIEKVRSNSVFGYIVKYINKGLGSEYMERLLRSIKGRRVGFSRGMTLADTRCGNWQRLGPIETIQSMQTLEQVIKDLNDKAGKKTIELISSGESLLIAHISPEYTDETVRYHNEYLKALSYVRRRCKSDDPLIQEDREWKFEHLFRNQPIYQSTKLASHGLHHCARVS